MEENVTQIKSGRMMYVDASVKNLISVKKIQIFKKVEKVLVCNKIFSGEKNYKYFIGHLYNDHKVKPLHIMLPKTSS